MSIIYPIVQGGGGGGDATSLRGINISSNTPAEGQVLYFNNVDWEARFLQNFLQMYAAPTYFTGASPTEVTKISFSNFIQGSGSVYFRLTSGIQDSYTGSFSISGTNEGYVLENQHITSNDPVTLAQVFVSASSLYTVFASSSSPSSGFKIYSIITAI